MRRVALTIAVLTALMLVPAASSMAKPGKARGIAASTCAQERKTVGQTAFAAKYLEPVIPTCRGFIRELAHNASQQCRAERKERGRDVFRNRYGTRRTERNAFGRCVSAKVKRAAATTCPGDLEDEDEVGEEELGEEELGEEEETEEPVEERAAHASQFASCDDEDVDDADDPVEEDPAEEELDL